MICLRKRSANDPLLFIKQIKIVDYSCIFLGYSTNVVVHEPTDFGVVKESSVLETCDGGGKVLKKAFKKFYSDVFEKDTLTTFMVKYKKEWSQMKEYFLNKCYQCDPSANNVVRFKLNSKLVSSSNEDLLSGRLALAARLKSKDFKGMFISADKICLPSELFQTIIEPSVKPVILHIDAALKKNADVAEIVVFGEFTKLPMLQHDIVKEFSERKVTFYEEETHSALKGAVIIGLGLGQIEKIDRVCLVVFK